MTTGTLITVYRGCDIRESAQIASGIALGVNIYRAGEFIGFEKNTALAKSRIDAELAKEPKGAKPASIATTTAPELTPEQRFAANKRKMGRYENNPDDLI